MVIRRNGEWIELTQNEIDMIYAAERKRYAVIDILKCAREMEIELDASQTDAIFLTAEEYHYDSATNGCYWKDIQDAIEDTLEGWEELENWEEEDEE